MINSPAPFPPWCALNKRRLESAANVQAPGITADGHSGTLGDLWARQPSNGTKTFFEPCEVIPFLRRELSTPTLDGMYDLLWLAARKSGDNIDPLHRQLIKNRTILLTEDPKLHLVWTASRVYVKPVPHCLLNHNFWSLFLSGDGTNASESHISHSVALGFLRSYYFLIRHRSDFSLAKELRLIPSHLKWTAWNRFIIHFGGIADSEVAKRYHYGQLRLSRLNWTLRVSSCISGRIVWFYELPEWSTWPYVARFAAPLVFLFAASSLMLSAMQVMLGADLDATPGKDLYNKIFWGYSIAVIAASILTLLLLAILPVLYILRQLTWGFLHRKGGK
jgi:hypothetical protein